MFDMRRVEVEINPDDVHPDGTARILLFEPASQEAKFFLFVPVNHLLRQTKKKTALGLHFDKNDDFFVFGKKVNLPKIILEVFRQNLVPLLLKKVRRQLLPDFPRCQPGLRHQSPLQEQSRYQTLVR